MELAPRGSCPAGRRGQFPRHHICGRRHDECQQLSKTTKFMRNTELLPLIGSLCTKDHGFFLISLKLFFFLMCCQAWCFFTHTRAGSGSVLGIGRHIQHRYLYQYWDWKSQTGSSLVNSDFEHVCVWVQVRPVLRAYVKDSWTSFRITMLMKMSTSCINHYNDWGKYLTAPLNCIMCELTRRT